jgi:HEAT repeat protein
VKLRDALIQQSPSIALQRAAADEIARLDQRVAELAAELAGIQNRRMTAPRVTVDELKLALGQPATPEAVAVLERLAEYGQPAVEEIKAGLTD